MKRRSSYGVYELIVGILLILLGIFTFTRSQSALTGLVVLYGLLATITGIGDIVFYVKMENASPRLSSPSRIRYTPIINVMESRL